MTIGYFAFPISGLALLVVVSIILRHWKEIRLLDPLSIKEERQRQKRELLIRGRFDRLRSDQAAALKRVGRHIKQSMARTYHNTYQRLQNFEALYHNMKSPLTSMAPSTRERVKTSLEEGRSLMRDLKWADAERRFLEVLALEPRHAEGYKGLGQIYLKQKLYPQAKETYEFLLKLKKDDDAVFAALAEIAEAEGRVEEAENFLLKAVEANPRLAFRHAELANYYLLHQAPQKAWPSAKRASDLEPKSAKYLELSLEAAILLGNQLEAQKRFERLRLLSDDRNKFHTWKEKLETLENKK